MLTNILAEMTRVARNIYVDKLLLDIDDETRHASRKP